MARTRTFDQDAVLTGAMMAFREHGFAGASIRDLERATGLSAGSLYNAFGDKQGLYRAAFDHYFKLVIIPRLGSARTLDDVEAAFVALFEPPMTDGFGCMVINGAIEFGGGKQSPAADFIARGLDVVDEALARIVGPQARRLTLIYQGLLVLSRSGRPMEPFLPAIREEFARLRHPSKEETKR